MTLWFVKCVNQIHLHTEQIKCVLITRWCVLTGCPIFSPLQWVDISNMSKLYIHTLSDLVLIIIKISKNNSYLNKVLCVYQIRMKHRLQVYFEWIFAFKGLTASRTTVFCIPGKKTFRQVHAYNVPKDLNSNFSRSMKYFDVIPCPTSSSRGRLMCF